MTHWNSDVNAFNRVNPVRGQHSQPCQYGQCRQKTAAAKRRSCEQRPPAAAARVSDCIDLIDGIDGIDIGPC